MDRPAKSSHYDVIVVGAGPAGISAAINVANRKKTVTILDSQHPFAKTRKASTIPNYPGFAYTSGEDLAAAFTRHLDDMNVPVFLEKVAKVVPDGEELVVYTDRDMYRAKAVVLATGVYREVDIEGEEALLGQGVSYCVNCDGRLFAGRDVAVVSYIPEGEEEASAMADDYSAKVWYVPLYDGEYRLPASVKVMSGERPTRLFRKDGKVVVELPKDRLVVDGVFVTKKSVSPRELIDGLETDGRHLVVSRHMETGIPGLYAAGDCTGEPYQIAKAVGEGQVAALEAVRYIRDRELPKREAPALLTPGQRESLGRRLREQMAGPVQILHFSQLPGESMGIGPACKDCREAQQLLEELTALSPLLSLEVRDFRRDASLADELLVARIPATLVRSASGTAMGGGYPVRLYGVPTGYAFDALLQTILESSSGIVPLRPETSLALQALSTHSHLEVLGIPGCPRCLEMAQLASRFALAAPADAGMSGRGLSTDIVMLNEFPDLAQRHRFAELPVLVIDGTAAAVEAVDEERLLALVRDRGAERQRR